MRESSRLASIVCARCEPTPASCSSSAPFSSSRAPAPRRVRGAELPGRGPVITVLDEAGGPVVDAELWVLDRQTLRADAAVLASRITGDWVATSLQLATEVRRTDGEGRARLLAPVGRGAFIAARRGALFGSAEVPTIGRDGLVLSLRPRTSYRARVLDSSGRPAEGVPLTLAVPGEPRLERLPVTARHGSGRHGGALRASGGGPCRAAARPPGNGARGPDSRRDPRDLGDPGRPGGDRRGVASTLGGPRHPPDPSRVPWG